jgi:hypothetical protein
MGTSITLATAVPTTVVKFRASISTQVACPNGTTTVVNFNSLGSQVGTAYNAATGVFTVPVTGWYQFDVATRLDGGLATPTGELFIAIQVNNTDVERGGASVGGATTFKYAQVSTTRNLLAGNTVRVVVGNFSGAAVNAIVSGFNNFSGAQIADATVANPGTVPVLAMNHATGSRSTAQAFTTAATAAVPQTVLFNAHTSLSGTITLNAATGELTLPAGTYKVAGGLGSANALARTFWRWYVNGVGGGAFGGAFSPTGTEGNAQISGSAHHEFTCPAGTLLKLGVAMTTTNVTFGGQVDTPLAFPWYTIEQLATATVVNAGTVPVILDTTLATGSNANVPSSTAIKTYVDTRLTIPVVQTFNASATYTPTAGMKWCEVEAVGGGGGSGGCAAGGDTSPSIGGAGGAGSYARIRMTAAQVGVSRAVVIGAAGTAGAVTPTAGGAGGTTSITGVLTCPGGLGGATGAGIASGQNQKVGGAGGALPTVATATAVLLRAGDPGQRGMASTGTSTAAIASGDGGGSPFGRGGTGVAIQHTNATAVGAAGAAGLGNGAGASGSYSAGAGGTARAGAAGTAGTMRITEYF